MTVVFELFAGITTLGILLGYSYKRIREKEPENYGTYCLCYTKDKNNTYVPWMTCTYKTVGDYENATDEIVKIAFDKEKNFYLREKGFSGIAVVNLDDGREEYWCTLVN